MLPAKKYMVEFIAYFEDEANKVEFWATEPESVRGIIAALAAFNSGDECECYINGEQAVLEGDWGLL